MNHLAEIRWMWANQIGGKLWIAVLISVIFAAFGRAVRGVTASGALAGAAACFALLLAAGPRGLTGLFVVFLITWASTRVGYSRKQSQGIAERSAGRGACQVFANLGVASFCAIVYAAAWPDSRLLIALTAALCEAAADTVSSEIGQAAGGVPRMVTNWKPFPRGTDGAITLSGTAAGIGAAIAVSLTGIVGWRLAPVCGAAGVAGMFADSVLGATLERRGVLGNNAVNFSSTAIAALLAFLVN
jgi:uncharacterized protein (TIGR00297 family)